MIYHLIYLSSKYYNILKKMIYNKYKSHNYFNKYI